MSTVTMNDVGAWPVEGLGGLEGSLLHRRGAPGPPGADPPPRRLQFVYVLKGTVVSQMDGEPRATYRQGEAWFEARARRHVVFANETDRPAEVLVLFLTEPGAPPLSFD